MLIVGAAAHADDTSFYIVPMDTPTSISTVTEVASVNDDGTFTLVGTDSNGHTRSFVMQAGTWIEVPAGAYDNIRITQINDANQVAGYRWDDGMDHYAFRYDLDSSAFTGLGQGEALGISNQGDIVGWRDGLGPVAVVGGTQLVDLPGYSGGTASAAYAINQRGTPGQQYPPVGMVVGRSTDGNGVYHAVAWIDDGQTQSVVSLSQDVLGTTEYYPTSVNDSGVVVGYAWDPVGTTSDPEYWVIQLGSPITTTGPYALPEADPGDAAAPDVVRHINNSNACVGGGRIWKANDPGANRYVEVGDYGYRAWPMTSADSDWSLYGLNDHGAAVGIGDFGNGDQPVFVLAVDLDRTGVADYLEYFQGIAPAGPPPLPLTDPIDPVLLPMPGLHAPGEYTYTKNNGLEDNNYIRLMWKQYEVEDTRNSVAVLCRDFVEELNAWGNERNTYIAVTMRTAMQDGWNVGTSDNDYIPPVTATRTGELSRPDVLGNLRWFARSFGDYVDFLQIANEAFTGAGAYFLEDFEYAPGMFYTGDMQDIPADGLAPATVVISAWFDQLRSSYLKGLVDGSIGTTQVVFIGPGVPLGHVITAGPGDPDGTLTPAYPANRAAFGLEWLTNYANERNFYFDVHFHYYDYNQFDEAITLLDPVGTPPLWTLPEEKVALELGPIPSWGLDGQGLQQWWGRPFPGNFFTGEYRVGFQFLPDSDPRTDPTTYTADQRAELDLDWNALVDDWIEEDTDMGYLKLSPPGSPQKEFAEYAVEELFARNYLLVGWADTIQHNNTNVRRFDLSAIWANKIEDHQSGGVHVWTNARHGPVGGLKWGGEWINTILSTYSRTIDPHPVALDPDEACVP